VEPLRKKHFSKGLVRMSNAKRSRATGNLVPLDAGKKNHAPLPPTAPDPGPLIPCLKVKVLIAKDHAIWVEVANYPAEGGLDAFYDLIHTAPDDHFMMADRAGSLGFSSIIAIGKPKEPEGEFPVMVQPSPPGEPLRLYRRLKVPVELGRVHIVEVANVPWTDAGIAHFGRLIAKHRRCDFETTEPGYMPARCVKLEDLRMPEQAPETAQTKLRSEDILRPEDIPE
jgi:hypothetical protein